MKSISITSLSCRHLAAQIYGGHAVLAITHLWHRVRTSRSGCGSEPAAGSGLSSKHPHRLRPMSQTVYGSRFRYFAAPAADRQDLLWKNGASSAATLEMGMV